MKSSRLTSILEDFEQNGFVGPLDILSPTEAKSVLGDVEAELCKPDANRFKLHLVIPSLSKLAHHPALISAVQQALGTEDVLLWSSDINTKPPKSHGYFAPHQDSTYAGLTPASKCLTAWMALSDPVGSTEGCLSFYPGSHIFGQLPHETRRSENADNNLLSLGQCISTDRLQQHLEKKQPRQLSLRGGQATLHSFYSVHFSGPNQTDRPRIGFALRYMSSTVHQSKPVKEMVTWISGKMVDEIRHFDFEPILSPKPTSEEVRTGYIVREEAMKREEANYFASAATIKEEAYHSS